jgi:hypothetical protein
LCGYIGFITNVTVGAVAMRWERWLEAGRLEQINALWPVANRKEGVLGYCPAMGDVWNSLAAGCWGSIQLLVVTLSIWDCDVERVEDVHLGGVHVGEFVAREERLEGLRIRQTVTKSWQESFSSTTGKLKCS